jgi:hypothetical protein
MTSKIIVNNIQSDTGVSTVTIASPVALSGGITGTGFAVGTGASISSPATNVLTVSTNNVERIRVGAAGSIGIGTVNPTSLLHLYGSSGPQLNVQSSSGDSQLRISSSAGNYRRIIFYDSAATPTKNNFEIAVQEVDNSLFFGPSTAVGGLTFSGSTGLIIDSSGRVTTPYQVYFYARPSTSINQTSGTLQYSAVDYNIGNHYNTSTYTFTAPVAGVYCISFQFFPLVNAAGGADLVVNGVLTMRCGREGTETYYEGYSNSINKYLNTNDAVNVQLYTGTIHLNTPYSHFSAYLLG